MQSLQHRRIVLGVTGGIAAYKSPEIVRRLREQGAEVRVVMTPSATRFITALTLQAVAGTPVHIELLDPATESGMGHIELARWAEAVVVAPASADFIARLRQGRANDLLCALCLTTAAPLLLAPAMNQQMWRARATADNVRALEERGVRMVGPASGDQACGETGPGRLEEPPAIVQAAAALFRAGELAGLKVLVTAGPTREPIDAVRFISNRSSGRMGYALAQAALDAGARVTLVSGPVALPPPPQATVIRVETAAQMHAQVMPLARRHDIFIACAAVADYAPANTRAGKLKKQGRKLTLTLHPTADILAEVAKLRGAPFTCGFAAETDDLVSNARSKLDKKALDMIAANWVGRPDLGFDSADNELHVLWPGGEILLQKAPKPALAAALIGVIAERYRGTGRRPRR